MKWSGIIMCEAESRGDEEEQVKGEEGLLSVSPGDTHTHKRVGVESINTSQLLGENSALYIFSAIVYFISHAITTITAMRTRTERNFLQDATTGSVVWSVGWSKVRLKSGMLVKCL